ncbi:hypothetical protein Pcinc_043183 [Petrolisthes cinctipes]|uniref:Uncharacterized protein n=1 Tax=Petrolisthes cinctipes TaxID=88211 RepID=A0AAE1BG20_PETCI|nr:hypothetical protein Pcinc_043183 [Petrolisthes cinctipes]
MAPYPSVAAATTTATTTPTAFRRVPHPSSSLSSSSRTPLVVPQQECHVPATLLHHQQQQQKHLSPGLSPQVQHRERRVAASAPAPSTSHPPHHYTSLSREASPASSNSQGGFDDPNFCNRRNW